MKRILCLALCVVTLAAVIAVGQSSRKKARKKTSSRAAAALDDRDPFNASPGDASPADAGPDPFGADSPFAGDADPFGGETPRKPVPKPSGQGSGLLRGTAPQAAVSSITVRQSAARDGIESALDEEATFEFVDQPLQDVVADVAHRHKIPIVLDAKSLDDFGIDTGTPITVNLKGVSLRSALRLMLANLELTYMIRDEVLQITTPETAEAFPQVRLFSVSDVLPADRGGDWLLALVTTVIAPDTWDEVGGPGSVVYIDHLEALAVRQTDEVLEEVGQLLRALTQLPKD
jgi:hypothetical protein